MARRRVAAEKVVWHAPETLNQTELAERLAGAETPEEALEILNTRPTVGEFRVVEEALAPQEGPEGTTVLGPKYGDLVVWVDEAPDDKEDGSGHFETYDADKHGEEYAPVFRGEA
jgi:hypothetical protein